MIFADKGERMELSIQERLKDLRVERGLTLEQLAEKTVLRRNESVAFLAIEPFYLTCHKNRELKC